MEPGGRMPLAGGGSLSTPIHSLDTSSGAAHLWSIASTYRWGTPIDGMSFRTSLSMVTPSTVSYLRHATNDVGCLANISNDDPMNGENVGGPEMSHRSFVPPGGKSGKKKVPSFVPTGRVIKYLTKMHFFAPPGIPGVPGGAPPGTPYIHRGWSKSATGRAFCHTGKSAPSGPFWASFVRLAGRKTPKNGVSRYTATNPQNGLSTLT